MRRLRFDLLLILATSLLAPSAQADVAVARLVQSPRLLALMSRLQGSTGNTLRLVVTGRDGGEVSGAGLVPLARGVAALTTDSRRLPGLLAEHPDWNVSWSPPKHTLLDQVIPETRADDALQQFGNSGQGVVVGIVDTGLDVTHPDLRRADGTSRVAWLLDLSRPPREVHRQIEEDFGCFQADASCAVYSGPDIDELISNDTADDEPRDGLGHGTHVASLAAGNGLSTNPVRYRGMAPEATLVVVRATRDDGGAVYDADMLLAVRFVFEMAERLGAPAVVNLSLGGDFGAHDGTSDLERALTGSVGDEYPGRAIVVAAGNSAGVYGGLPIPEPVGIHTVVQVLPGAATRVPIWVGASPVPLTENRVFAWIATRPGDRIDVGLDWGSREWIAPIRPGDVADGERDGLSATIYNGITESDHPEGIAYIGAAVLLVGPFDKDTTVPIRLQGQGTASIWIQADGSIASEAGGKGAWMSGAQREGTITVPASAPALIAVGATLNRAQWTDVEEVHQVGALATDVNGRIGSVMPFSSAGPNALDHMKPDILAPGAYVAGALSGLADPRSDEANLGMFDGAMGCYRASAACLVMDGFHALAVGTSMASPIVAGAVAQMLEMDPELTQLQVRRLLQVGAQRVRGFVSTPAQVGPGVLDLHATLQVLDGGIDAGSVPDSEQSWLSLSKGYAHPGHDYRIDAVLHLRDQDQHIVDLPVRRLRAVVDSGHIVRELRREGPGYYLMSVAANHGSGGETLRIRVEVDGQLLVRESIPIAVDASFVRNRPVAGNGCAVATCPSLHGGPISFLGWGLLSLGLCLRRPRLTARHGTWSRGARNPCSVRVL